MEGEAYSYVPPLPCVTLPTRMSACIHVICCLFDLSQPARQAETYAPHHSSLA